MKIFITGGTGFIGRYVVGKLVKEKHELLILTRNPKSYRKNRINLLIGDISKTGLIRKKIKAFKPDYAVHLAWESLPKYDYLTSIKNLKNSIDMVSLLAEYGCKKIFCAGSCFEYGGQAGSVEEESPLRPFNSFSAAKKALHLIGDEIARERGVALIWGRIFFAYGLGQREQSLVPYLIKCAKHGKNPQLKTPYSRNDFIYVEDVADAIAMALKKCSKTNTYNIGSGYPTSVSDIAKVIFENFGIKLDMGNGSDYKPESDFWANISKIKQETGWEPKFNIEKGLRKTIENAYNFVY